MQYFVMKSGMEMFDVCRAYGLGLILNTLAEIEEIDFRIEIRDLGPYYLINGPEIHEIKTDLHKNKSWTGIFDFANRGWDNIFLTFLPTQRTEKCEKIKRTLTNNFREIIQKYKEPSLPEIIYKASLNKEEKKNYETIPLSLDVSAGKGIKKPKLSEYDDGWQSFVHLDHLSLACVGAAHFIHWIWSPNMDNVVGIIPSPQRIILNNHFEIEKILRSSNLNRRAGTTTTLAHYAVNLAINIRNKRADQSSYVANYSSLIYNAMVRSVNQYKPISSGLFPLELLFSLMEDDLHLSAEIFETWNNIFGIGSRRGNEDLAMFLAEFIPHPSISTLEEHLKIHLKYLLDEKVKVRAYTKNSLEEVMKFVES